MYGKFSFYAVIAIQVGHKFCREDDGCGRFHGGGDNFPFPCVLKRKYLYKWI